MFLKDLSFDVVLWILMAQCLITAVLEAITISIPPLIANQDAIKMRREVLRASLEMGALQQHEANHILAQVKIVSDYEADIKHRRGVQQWKLLIA
eukprot:3295678-Rhodomonas_salina.1